MQCRRFGGANIPRSAAFGTSGITAFYQCRTQSLARQFQQAKTANFAHLHARAVKLQGFAQNLFYFTLVLWRFHINKINHHQTAQIAQAQLARQFFCGFPIGLKSRVFNIRTFGGAPRIHIHRHQRFGVVNHNSAARWQIHLARKSAFNLSFYLKTRKKRHIISITFNQTHIVGHHRCHKRLRLLENIIGVNQNFANIGLKIIANGANDQTAFQIN